MSGNRRSTSGKTSGNGKTPKRPNNEIIFDSVEIRRNPHKKMRKPGAFSIAMSLVTAIVAFTFVGGIIWRASQPASFDQFWQKNIMPVLPSQVKQMMK
jgi:hypothetical protein